MSTPLPFGSFSIFVAVWLAVGTGCLRAGFDAPANRYDASRLDQLQDGGQELRDRGASDQASVVDHKQPLDKAPSDHKLSDYKQGIDTSLPACLGTKVSSCSLFYGNPLCLSYYQQSGPTDHYQCGQEPPPEAAYCDTFYGHLCAP